MTLLIARLLVFHLEFQRAFYLVAAAVYVGELGARLIWAIQKSKVEEEQRKDLISRLR